MIKQTHLVFKEIHDMIERAYYYTTLLFFQRVKALIVRHSKHFNTHIHEFSHGCFLRSSEMNDSF